MKRRHDHDHPEGEREPSELTEVFQRQTSQLPPPPGSFDEIRGRARARRRGRVLWTSLAAAGCVAAVAVALNMTNDSPPTTVAVAPDDTATSRPATGHTEDGGGTAASSTPDDSAPAAGRQPAKSAPPQAETRSAPGPATCRTADLQITLGAGEGAAGSQYRPLRVTNGAATPCTLFGFPGVSLVDGQGHQVGEPADRDGSQASGRVVMKPGQRAQVTLRIVDPGVHDDNTCHITDATGVRVYPPGERASVIVPAKGLRGCAGTGVTTLSVTSYGVH